jgi:hypothetical protein
VEFKSVAQILESIFFGNSLAGNVDLDALRDVPFAFLPDTS